MLHSLQAFVKYASSFSHEAVDKLLDALTEGAHSKYLKVMAEVRCKISVHCFLFYICGLIIGELGYEEACEIGGNTEHGFNWFKKCVTR